MVGALKGELEPGLHAGFSYPLDAFQYDNHDNVLFTKKICVDSCPTENDVCHYDSLPCKNPNQYRSVKLRVVS
jgi:hypothetical protein